MTIVMIPAVVTEADSPASPAPPTLSRPHRRRREVIDAAWRVIVRDGLEATTLRKIAHEGGFTTGVVSHYFADKRAVIVSSFEAASADFLGDFADALDAAPSAAAQLIALVETAVPDDSRRRAEWRLWSEMWSYAARDADFRRTLVATDAQWEGAIADVLAAAQAEGLLDARLDAAREATIVARLVDGLGVRAWLSGDWDGARRVLEAHLETLRAERGDRVGAHA